MLFNAVASAVLLATAANAAAKPQPYRLAVMALPGQSLMRRDTAGYKPDQKTCKAGNTCAEACGAGYDQCIGGAAHDIAHCFNPAAGESCCTDDSGNSCEAGYYCTHDDAKQTWCCPNSMDLAACAAAFTVKGKLQAATSKPAPSTTSHSTHTTTTPSTTSEAVTSVVDKNTTICASSSGKTTAWIGSNSTISTPVLPTQPSEVPSITVVPPPQKTNAAAATGVSALLIVAAGFVALL